MLNNLRTIIIFGNARSAHIQNWAKILSEFFTVEIISLSKPNKEQLTFYKQAEIKLQYPHLKWCVLDNQKEGAYLKLLSLIFLPWIASCIIKSSSNIVHVHYASSYGFLGALLPNMNKKWILSVWGSDLYNFPKISLFHKLIFSFLINRYICIQVTSKFMMLEIKKWVNINLVEIVPFPVDTNRFNPQKKNKLNKKKSFHIGTVKTLHPKYGVEYLIRAADLLKKKGYSFILDIYGDGPDKKKLEILTNNLGLGEITFFHGKVEFHKVQNAYSSLDIYLALSVDESETFGVAVLEASSCEIPVIVTNCGGLPEVVIDSETGFIVDKFNIIQVVEKLETLINNQNLRIKFGENGRKRVIENYSSNICLFKQKKIYDRFN